MGTISGDSLLVRVNTYRRPHRKFYGAELTLRMYLDEAASNDGRLLWVGTIGPYSPKYLEERNITNLIVLNGRNMHAIVGHIVGVGTHYDPSQPTPIVGYNPVPPLAQTPDALWIALRDVQDVPSLDTDDYITVTPPDTYTPSLPLTEALKRTGVRNKNMWIRSIR